MNRLSSNYLVIAAVVAGAGCGKPEPRGLIAPQQAADALFAVVSAHREVYASEVVARLGDDKVVRATERFRDDKALPLPAQVFRMSAEVARKSAPGFSFALLSLWPINRQNAPRTEAEKVGLSRVAATGKPHYAEEVLGGKRYFTAVYADRAVSDACVGCHNTHADSPKHDFAIGDTMGGVVIRIALRD